jgi:hypothetical protein
MRAVPPEPAERPKIKKAMRAARFMNGGAPLVAGLAFIAGIIIGGTSGWYLGVIVFTVPCAALFIIGYSAARCPRCGQVWYGTPPWASEDGVDQTADETDTMICRRCRLDIGLGLSDS